MVDDVRLRYQRQFQDAGDTESLKKLKGIIRLLKTREDNQVKYWGSRFNENKQRLQDAFEVAPDLLEAYDSLQFFHDILASWPYSVQYEELTEWIKRSGYPIRKFQYQRNEISGAWTQRQTFRYGRGGTTGASGFGRNAGQAPADHGEDFALPGFKVKEWEERL